LQEKKNPQKKTHPKSKKKTLVKKNKKIFWLSLQNKYINTCI
jgi:hypothetical protein